MTQKLRGVVSFCESTASSFLNSEDRHPICRAILALGKAIDWHKALKHAKFGDLKESIVYIYIYFFITHNLIPVVPHKAVAEVSKIGNL